MKRIAVIALGVMVLFAAPVIWAQDNLFEFESYAKEKLDEVATPLVEAFGTGVCGGLYHTAKTHNLLGFDVGVRAMMVIIPEGESEIFDASDVSLFPVPVIQASLGLPMDFEVMVRGLSIPFEDESITLFGAGLKKNFKSLIPIPGFPDLSAMIAYHKFEASDVLNSTHLSFDFMVSKKFLIITPYGGIGFDRTKMEFDYTYGEDDPIIPDTPIHHEISASTARFTVGLNLTPIPFVNVFADYNVGKFSEITAGVAIGIN